MRFLFAFLLVLIALPALAATAVVGEKAPDFTGTDSLGREVKLSDYAGKVVVLEWTNDQCPYVKKHYTSGNMQKTQKAAMDDGAIWLRIISSAPGKQGHVTGQDAQRIMELTNAAATATILDESGVIGRLYDAKTTPDMYVIDSHGTLVYAGAIDDKPTTDVADIDTAKNYIKMVLDDIKVGRPVSVGETKSYGCGIKY
jgi:peroxiredoxin